jgi:hypothetical protein
MNYSEILQNIGKGSLFDIYRLSVAMGTLLNQSDKLLSIKRQLRLGMTISYFNNQSNKLVDAIIGEIRQSSVYVIDKNNGKQWSIPLYAINLENVNTDIRARSDQRKLDRNQFQVGELVSFLGKNDQETYGRITQLNPKTASITTRDGTNWRVYYSHLFKILDAQGDTATQETIIDVTL